MKKTAALILSLLLLLNLFSGCDREQEDRTVTQSAPTEETVSPQPVTVDFSKTDGDMFTDRDGNASYDESKAVTIALEENGAVASSETVKISGSKVTITQEATYVISGSLSDGMLIVDAPDTAKLQLVFNGVSITSKTSAALYILEADKVFLTLAEGTDNLLAGGDSFEAIDENNIDGVLYSRQDLTINGTGALTVTSPAGHGIVCKDDLVIMDGTYGVNSAGHGLDVNDSFRMAGGSLIIDAGKDGVHAENTDDAALGFVYISGGTVQAEAEGDGIAAGAYLQLQDGTVNLLAGGGSVNASKESSDHFGGFMGGGRPGGMGPGGMRTTVTETEDSGTSMKGMKAVAGMLIAGGSITVDSADDALHSDASMVISGGEFTLASGDDALHAEETLTVTAGKMDISACYEGLEALHIHVQGGDIRLVASDDGLNAAGGTDQSGFTGGRDGMFGGGGPGMGGGMGGASNGSIQISGGNLYVNSSGDGLDANGTLEISGGYTVVVGPTRGDTATLDYDKSGIITGGTFIGTGAAGMAQSFSDSEQGVVAVSVGNQTAGTMIEMKDEKGNVLLTHTPELDFAVLIYSSPDVEKGGSYTVTVGTESGQITASE